ncbi:LytR/AlgR family response regulator transcription factor [Hymenobacter sp. BT491]|uniref:LytR/AlgR family response regulator transcription factor n=1 Tax=Hymenobacter sp. BT491 TaxID=2766779 RepID=UPI001653D363|nr:LytTR family DNA-binding domain-containing protein [Hymenobacter sp. BT491]MBC6992214.1 response regulator transcription factor [Hymenobacter sp. BT491]
MAPVEPIRTLIVDDEPLARRRLGQLLAAAPGYVVAGECSNGTEAVAWLEGEAGVDLVFLDVQMPDLSGLEVLQRVRGRSLPLVVFVTAYDQYTLQAFEARAIDYLLKPLDPDRFTACLAHARHMLDQRSAHQTRHHLTALLRAWPQQEPAPAPAPGADQFLLKHQGRLYFVKADQVLYLESKGNYVTLHTPGQQHLLRTTLSQLEGKLNSRVFLRIHRSVIVNSAYIKELRPWSHGEYLITLHDDTHLTSSRSYTQDIQRFLQRFAS